MFAQVRTGPAIIYAQTLESESSCCGGTSKTASSNTTQEQDDRDEENQMIAKYGTCCGFRRRIVCGKLFFPPRRSHSSEQSYASVLTPICIVFDVICVLSIYFLFGSHEYLHGSNKWLTIAVVSAGILLSSTAILHGLCFMAWWKSTSCIHHDFMGDFDVAEENYYTGFAAAEDFDNGKSTLAFFSSVSPFSDTDGYAQYAFGESDMESQDTLHPSSITTRPPPTPQINATVGPTGLDLRATSNYIRHRRQIFYAKVEKLDQAKSAMVWANTAPCFTCCGGRSGSGVLHNDTNPSDYD